MEEGSRIHSKALAGRISYDKSYVSRMKGGTYLPNEEVARKCDDVLRAGGALLRAYPSAVRLMLAASAPDHAMLAEHGHLLRRLRERGQSCPPGEVLPQVKAGSKMLGCRCAGDGDKAAHTGR